MLRNLLVKRNARRHGPTAFVLNINLQGLGAVRSLGRAGVPVIGLDPYPRHAGFASRYCAAKQCPHPVHEPDHLVEFLVNEGKHLDQPGVLSPASDAFVLFLSRYRDDLSPYFRFILPSPAVLEASVNKRELYALADNLGIPTPTTFYPQDMDDVLAIKHDLEYPVYIKPFYSHLWTERMRGWGKGVKVATPDALVATFEQIIPTGLEVMVQSIILGPATNVQSTSVYITADDELLATFTNRKIRQHPPEFGVAALAESIRSPELADLGIRFFEGIGYRGPGSLEFKRDDRDGKLKVTDLDARWWKFCSLSTDAGINFPLIHYLDMIGQTPAPQRTFKESVRWLDSMDDFMSCWGLMRSGELTPWAWARAWVSARSFATFALDDPGPWLKHYRYGRLVLRAPGHMWRNR